jgi:integrase
MRAKKPYLIVFSKSLGTWHLRWYENGVRKSKQLGDIRDLPTLEAAKKKATPLIKVMTKPVVPLVRDLVDDFKKERMSTRFSTRTAGVSRFENHVIPKWGDSPITALQHRPVELWLRELVKVSPVGETPEKLSAKSKVHIRGLLGQLWDYAMWRGDVELTRNPMSLVEIKGATTEKRKPRSLTVEEFQKFVAHLEEPIRTVAFVCVCLGLRISECLALQWSDIDWFNKELRVERGIVRGRVGELKTAGSRRKMALAPEMIGILSARRRATEFSEPDNWIFASPVSIGRNPISYPWVWVSFQDAARKAGIEHFGTHSMRHSYRSWLDAAGTPLAVQQKAMRHADIRTTMNTYGEVVTDELKQANSAVAKMAIRA